MVQAIANRNNAAKSTGPKTKGGKASVSEKEARHGQNLLKNKQMSSAEGLGILGGNSIPGWAWPCYH